MDDENGSQLNASDWSQVEKLWQHAIADWQRDDLLWQQDIANWLHHTQRLVAILYLLEKALPEHSSQLDQHKSRIDDHNALLNHHRQKLEVTCRNSNVSESDLKQHKKMHEVMAKNHHKMQLEHDKLSKDYLSKMQQFGKLAERLHDELDDF